MKKAILPLLLTFLSTSLLAQVQAEITADREHEGGRIVKGVITAEWLLKDSVFNKDYTGRPPGYTPDAQALDILRRKGYLYSWAPGAKIPGLWFRACSSSSMPPVIPNRNLLLWVLTAASKRLATSPKHWL